jgi:hypothetical protein
MPYTSRDEITTAVQSAVREALETAQSSPSSELEGILCIPFHPFDQNCRRLHAPHIQLHNRINHRVPPDDLLQSPARHPSANKRCPASKRLSPLAGAGSFPPSLRSLSDTVFVQCCENTQIHFTETYWPDFGFWDFIPILLDYQRKAWTPKPEDSKR